MDLTLRNVVYLGGFGGIGQKACAELLQRQLQSLVVFDLTLNEQLLGDWQSKYANTKIIYRKLDITQKSEIEAAYKEADALVGQIDVVINGMGLMDDRHVELTIQINLLGVIHSCLTALEYMDKSKGGRGGLVVNISSVAGIQPTANMAIYSAAKHGVTALTRSLADPAYFAHTAVAFITICPGFTDTPLLDKVVEKTTFKFDTPSKHVIPRVKRQSAEICAQNLVKVIEEGSNGSIWLLDIGEMKQIEIPPMWRPQLEA